MDIYYYALIKYFILCHFCLCFVLFLFVSCDILQMKAYSFCSILFLFFLNHFFYFMFFCLHFYSFTIGQPTSLVLFPNQRILQRVPIIKSSQNGIKKINTTNKFQHSAQNRTEHNMNEISKDQNPLCQISLAPKMRVKPTCC